MSQSFEHQGIAFQYPENWKLEREKTETGWGVFLQSPGTAFLLLSCDDSMPTAEDVASTALDALRSEYPGLEADARIEKIGGQLAVGHDVEFFHFDLTNTCWTRACYSEAGTVLVLCQFSDVEADTYGPALRAVCASLRLDEP